MTQAMDRIAIVGANQLAVPLIQLLAGQQRLAGVIFAPFNDPALSQLAQALHGADIPCVSGEAQQSEPIVDTLVSWEAAIAVNFAFDFAINDIVPKLQERMRHFDLFHIQTSEDSQFAGPYGLYWQIREGVKDAQVMVCHQQSASVVKLCDYRINPLDTLNSLEFQVSRLIADAISQQSLADLFSHARQSQPLSPCQDRPALSFTEQDLRVDWLHMSAEQICDLARAGNPRFGGGIVTLGQTELNLLQATLVNYPTYGVGAGTLCYCDEDKGAVVATKDGALRIDILANVDGVFGGLAFCQRFGIEAGMSFS